MTLPDHMTRNAHFTHPLTHTLHNSISFVQSQRRPLPDNILVDYAFASREYAQPGIDYFKFN